MTPGLEGVGYHTMTSVKRTGASRIGDVVSILSTAVAQAFTAQFNGGPLGGKAKFQRESCICDQCRSAHRHDKGAG